MRTTVTLDDDVLRELREIMRTDDVSFKQALNEVIRRGIASRKSPSQPRPRFVVRPHSSEFAPGIDLTRLNQLVDDLEVEEWIERHKK